MGKRTILHVDMDAFFASIEQRDNPKYKGKPIIVGGSIDNRGVVSTASYEARSFGVHSAMAIVTAKKLCPNGYFIPVNMAKYKKVSREIQKIFSKYSMNIEPISIDEAFLDITGLSPLKTAKSIKEEILIEQELTASIGISNNKFLAKLASEMEKPNGLTIIRQEEAIQFLKPLPINKLWGVGPKTEEELNRIGIYTIGDLQNYDMEVLFEKFGKRGEELMQFSLGIDDRPIERNITCQSIGEEETFSKDIINMSILRKKLVKFSQNLSFQLEQKGYLARTITVKIKYEDFSIESRSITLNIPTNNAFQIYEASNLILNRKFRIKKKVRLLGLAVSNFIYPDEPLQLSFRVD